MKLILVLLLALTGITMTSVAEAQNSTTADVIFVNGDIYTGAVSVVSKTGADAQFAGAMESGRAQAVAVAGGKIIAVGSSADIQKLKGPKTEVIDLAGHFAMPGFNDAHVHLGSGGFEKLNVDLVGAKSLANMKDRIAARVKAAAPGEWITGRGWDHTLWAVQETPTRADMDAVTGDHPAIFNRVDGHIAIANSAALKAAGITSSSADPHGGKIDKDEKGEPTGILRETAMGLVGEKIPAPTMALRRRLLNWPCWTPLNMASHLPRTTLTGKISLPTSNWKKKAS